LSMKRIIFHVPVRHPRYLKLGCATRTDQVE
jgi:hypothetical protein